MSVHVSIRSYRCTALHGARIEVSLHIHSRSDIIRTGQLADLIRQMARFASEKAPLRVLVSSSRATADLEIGGRRDFYRERGDGSRTTWRDAESAARALLAELGDERAAHLPA